MKYSYLRRRAMQALTRPGCRFFSFWTSALDGGGWSALCCDRLTPRKEPGTRFVEEAGWSLGPVYTGAEKIKISYSYRNSSPESSSRSEALYPLPLPTPPRSTGDPESLWIVLGFLSKKLVRVPGYRYRGLGFDSRRYQIFWVVVGLERGTLSLVGSIEELLE